MKKQLVVFVWTLLPLMASAYDAQINGIYYNLDTENKTATVTFESSESVPGSYSTSYSSDYEGDVVIPDAVTWNGASYTVTTIGIGAFRGCSGLKSITIPSSITSISYAFDQLSAVYISDLAAWCAMDFDISNGSRWSPTMSNNPLYYTHSFYMNGEEVHDLVIPEGVTKIGSLAFVNCSSLTSVTIPSTLTSLGYGAFNSCSQLSAVHVSDLASWCAIDFNVKDNAVSNGVGYYNVLYTNNPLYYAHRLYLNGKEVTDLVIPEGVTRIGQNAFCHCLPLSSVTIPSSVTSIGMNAFAGCNQLAAVNISDMGAWCSIEFDVQNVTEIEGDTVHTNNPLYIAEHLYMNGKEITDLIIPEGVEGIGDWTFVNLNQLESVTIPSTVTTIGDNSFKELTTLMTVRSYIKEPFHVDCFSEETYRKGTLYVPVGTTNLYIRFDGWRNFLKIEEMEEGDSPAPNGECAMPTIIVMGNKFKFQCTTPGAEFTSSLTTAGEQFTGDEMVMDSKETTYTLTVYATAPGYSPSKPATYTFTLNNKDVNHDGAVDVADIATVIDEMAGK